MDAPGAPAGLRPHAGASCHQDRCGVLTLFMFSPRLADPGPVLADAFQAADDSVMQIGAGETPAQACFAINTLTGSTS